MSRFCFAAIYTAFILPGLLLAPPAHADGVISNVERAYVQAYGASAVCPTIADYPSEAGVMGIAQGIMEDGFAADSAVDIINASVGTYCPKFWPLLQAIGARNQSPTYKASLSGGL